MTATMTVKKAFCCYYIINEKLSQIIFQKLDRTNCLPLEPWSRVRSDFGCLNPQCLTTKSDGDQVRRYINVTAKYATSGFNYCKNKGFRKVKKDHVTQAAPYLKSFFWSLSKELDIQFMYKIYI